MQDPDKTTGNNLSAASSAQALRQRAENLARKKIPLSSKNLEALSPEAMRQTLHELQVHQIELEMQNEELRRAQLQLDSARARYFDLYDLAPVGYCTVSEQGLILEANIAAATLLGMTRSSLVGQRFSRFIATSHQDSFYLYRKQLLASGEQQGCEPQMLKSDGTPVWVTLQATAENNTDGVSVLRVVMSDATERRQADDAIRDSEERYRNLFNSMDEGFCVIEKIEGEAGGPLDFRYIEVNPAFMAQSGMTGVVGKTIRQMLPYEPEEWFVTYNRVCTTGIPIRFERSLVTHGRVLELYAFRIGGPESRKVAVIFNNITKRRLAEAERERLDQALQDKNADLERATIIADKANRAKSDFLSSMSHELRTPLSAILGFAQLIESGSPPPTPTQKRSVDQILHAGWYLLELINEILDLALVESGRLSLTQEPMSLAEVMQECRTMIESQADKRGISVRFPALEMPYFVRADRKRMKQIFINFLSNAIKYNRVGGTVEVKCLETNPERIRICVEDTGEGLSPEKIRQLFQPFNRLGQEANAEEGTGIGLVMAKRLVELMGGVIGVESTVGKGSTFWIEMDLMTERQTSEAAAQAQAQAQAQAVTQGQTQTQAQTVVRAQVHTQLRTLLYVEDNPANLLLVENLMERRPDMRLLSAGDGNSGIKIAHASLPDVILIDINLPGINGIEVLKILVNDRATAHIPVLALSANAIPHDIDNGLRAGFFRYLTKPIKIDEFMATLDEALAFATSVSGRAAKERSLS